MSNPAEAIHLQQVADYRFHARFGEGLPVWQTDEPAPLGSGQGPSPVQLLAAAVGNCLSASLLFGLRKFKQNPEPIACTVTADVGRNAEGRVRVLALHAELRLGVAASSLEHLQRVLDTFETYCTVTQSVQAAVPVHLSVLDAEGQRLK